MFNSVFVAKPHTDIRVMHLFASKYQAPQLRITSPRFDWKETELFPPASGVPPSVDLSTGRFQLPARHRLYLIESWNK